MHHHHMHNNITSFIRRKFKNMTEDSLIYEILAECKTSKARVGRMKLKHGDVDTPVFMPVGTQVIILLFFVLRKVYSFLCYREH